MPSPSTEEAYHLRPRRPARVRHAISALLLFVDDDAERKPTTTILRRANAVCASARRFPSGHDPAHYVTRRLFATAADGEQMPISLLYRKDLDLDGNAPLLLYGYGAYGTPMPGCIFGTNWLIARRSRLRLCDRPCPRRHRQGLALVHGRQARARSPIRSLISSPRATHLIASGYTRAGRIVAHGGSAGGMLMGAAVNLRARIFSPASLPTCPSSMS